VVSSEGGSKMECSCNAMMIVRGELKKFRDGHVLLPLKSVQTGPGAHAASYSMGIGGLFAWGKATGV
jgi:hypothetical protein